MVYLYVYPVHLSWSNTKRDMNLYVRNDKINVCIKSTDEKSLKDCDSNFEVNKNTAELYEKTLSVKLLFIVIIVFKPYPSTYCLM